MMIFEASWRALPLGLLLIVTACLPNPEFSIPDLRPSDDLAAPAPPDARSEPDLRDPKAAFTYDRGAITRGPKDAKVMALVYTGGFYADGGPKILDELKARSLKASFFFTGDFLRRAEFKPIIERIRDEGHYLGAHSDKHLLYASWDSPPALLVTQAQFDEDLTRNLLEIERFSVPREKARFFLPPYEHYTREIADWTTARGMVLINFTPGTSSHLDYLEDGSASYLSAPKIVETILTRELAADGLRGFMLLMHIGVSPGRTQDRLHDYLGALLDELGRRGHRFVRVDELLQGA